MCHVTYAYDPQLSTARGTRHNHAAKRNQPIKIGTLTRTNRCKFLKVILHTGSPICACVVRMYSLPVNRGRSPIVCWCVVSSRQHRSTEQRDVHVRSRSQYLVRIVCITVSLLSKPIRIPLMMRQRQIQCSRMFKTPPTSNRSGQTRGGLRWWWWWYQAHIQRKQEIIGSFVMPSIRPSRPTPGYRQYG